MTRENGNTLHLRRKTLLNVDSWIRFILTEASALVLLAFVFRGALLEERRNV